MKIDFFKIKANSPQRNSHPGFDSYVQSMQALVKETIPESVVEMHEISQFIPIESSFEKLNSSLPIVQISEEFSAPCILSLKVLAREEYLQGMEAFLFRMIDEKLLPGKKMAITFLRSLTFKFIVKPKTPYYVIEFFISVESEKDLQTIQKNFPQFKQEIRLTTLGVEHARRLVLAKGHSLEEKRMILLENFTSLLQSSSNFDQKTFFEDVQRILFKGIYEEYPDKIPDHLLPYIDAKPQTFDHHIFDEIENFSILFHGDFSQNRSLFHLSKIISYLYLFRKIISHSIQINPNSRHLSFKLVSFKVKETPILAVILGVNLIEDSENLEESDLLQAIQKHAPKAQLVPGSNVINERSKKRVLTLYLEVQKDDKMPFGAEALKLMRKKIPKEIRQSLHKSKECAIILPDETTRSILSLTKEIKSIHDPAKVIIQYHNQSPSHFHFSIILARLQEPEAAPLSLTSTLPIILRKMERKVVGILKKRFIKEVYLFDILIQKNGQSLKKARDEIFTFFKSHVHKLHDFNGGMVTRKYENLALFKSLINHPHSDTLVENYFYSISPSFMQTLSSAEVLKEHFHLILKALNHNFIEAEPLLLFGEVNDQTLIVCCSNEKLLIEEIKKRVASFSEGVTSTYLNTDDLHILGYMLPKNGKVKKFISLLKEEKLTV